MLRSFVEGPGGLLEQALARAFKKLKLPLGGAIFERPENPKHGDYATSAALRLAKKEKRPQMEMRLKI